MGCSTSAGGKGGSVGIASNNVPNISYPSLPFSTMFKGASKEDVKEKNKIIKSFISNAKEGDKYSIGGGFGSSGAEIEIVHYNRSPNKLGIRSGQNRVVALSNVNVEKYIRNGARLIKRNNNRK